MAEFNALWIGPRFSPLERACAQSYLAHGHELNIYAYDVIANVPTGCRLLDAATLIPAAEIFANESGAGRGSLGGFSDLFRYRLLHEHGGWWTDLDVFCLRPTFPDGEIVLGRQDAQFINGAVLRFPKGHPALLAAYDESRARGNAIDWAETGPVLLTRYVESGRITARIEPEPVFYPLHFTQFWLPFDPHRTEAVRAMIERSTCLHFWNEMIRRGSFDKEILPAAGSLLRELYERTIDTSDFVLEYVLRPGSTQSSLSFDIRELERK
jgi:hypothetical protein